MFDGIPQNFDEDYEPLRSPRFNDEWQPTAVLFAFAFAYLFAATVVIAGMVAVTLLI
jgi:hypothetical protein